MYKDGAIYLSPEQDNEEDLLDDILQNLPTPLKKNEDLIYRDGRLEREFVAKEVLISLIRR